MVTTAKPNKKSNFSGENAARRNINICTVQAARIFKFNFIGWPELILIPNFQMYRPRYTMTPQ